MTILLVEDEDRLAAALIELFHAENTSRITRTTARTDSMPPCKKTTMS